MKILITDKFDEEAISFLKRKKIEVVYQPEISPDELLEIVSDFEALIVRGRTKVTRQVIERGIKLKLIARSGSGTDNIDKDAAKAKNIAVINAPGANAQAVAELTIGLILSLIRKIPYADNMLRQGKWVKKDLLGTEIRNKTFGIIGYGHVGKKVGNLARGFGANILTYDTQDSQENLSHLLSVSDFVCLHLRLNDQTRHFINKEKLAKMKSSAYLINSARGELVVEDDLYETLVNKKVAGAAFDVYWREPMEENSRWFKLDNVVLTPHIGGQTKEALKNACMMVASDLVRFFKGEVINSRVV